MSRIKVSPIGPVLGVAILGLAALAFIAMSTTVRGQEDDILSFVPSGGRTLLSNVLEAGASPEIVSGDRDTAGWLEWIEANRGEVPGLEALDEYQARTLANYLAYAAPIDAEGMNAGALAEKLPRDGRDIALRYCQSCHIITVSITQDRTRQAWLGTLGNPSHVEIKIDEKERGLLADYYVVNGGIPIEQVPPALRAGGASY